MEPLSDLLGLPVVSHGERALRWCSPNTQRGQLHPDGPRSSGDAVSSTHSVGVDGSLRPANNFQPLIRFDSMDLFVILPRLFDLLWRN
jgi:hypothetical protein